MFFNGSLKKMAVSNSGETVEYFLPENIRVNNLLGKNIRVVFSGEIRCVKCHTQIKKTYNDGYCFKCFDSSPENAPCVIRPELCRGHLGEGRDKQWEQENHNVPHIVYLAQTDVVKVGVTRKSNTLNRWIDQGAFKATVLAETPNRFEAGRIELALKELISDRTNWRKMLTNEFDPNLDLIEEKWRLESYLPSDLSIFFSDTEAFTTLIYPVLRYPKKVQSIQLDKSPLLLQKVIGIRGQYLIFEDGTVLNIRKHSGYWVDIEVV
jgi:hypothetical protein